MGVGHGGAAPVWAKAGSAGLPYTRRPVLPDLSQGGFVDGRCAVVRAHRQPRPPQDVFAADLVLQRLKPLIRVGLGRPVQCVLQRSDTLASDSRQRGCSTAGCVVPRPDQYSSPVIKF